ncbi:MAG: MlaD family protein [Marmoricola sp.]
MSQPLTQAALTRRVRIAQVLLILIVVVGALMVGKLVLSGPLFSKPYRLQVELASAAGLHKKSDVSYRGQHIGTVDKVSLDPIGSQSHDHDQRGCADPRRAPRWWSPISRQWASNISTSGPCSSKGPWLSDGDVIASDQTTLPLPMSTVLNHAQMLLARVDPADLETLNTELNAVFEGQELDLRGLGSEVNRSVKTLQELQPRILELANTSQRPLQTLSDLSPQLRQAGRQLRDDHRRAQAAPARSFPRRSMQARPSYPSPSTRSGSWSQTLTAP